MSTAVDDILAQARVRAALPPPRERQALRTRFGLTLEDVADVVGVNPSTVSRWEQGIRTPRASLIPNYVELLERLAALDAESRQPFSYDGERPAARPGVRTTSGGQARHGGL